ncbi:MAG TPA: sulfate adenylyltransferase [Chthonomonadaceae bacterium]|nr:sulfate adenylyltransferase [Chthonomonadaceae bacterium]
MPETSVTAKVAQTIPPHGGILINRFVPEAQRAAVAEKAAALPKIALDARQISDLELIAIGAASPLTGFMSQADYESVVHKMQLANGLPWTIPVTLAVTPEQAAALAPGSQAALTDETGRLLAVLTVRDTYSYDQKVEAEKVYRTTEEAHPGVAALYAQPEALVGGDVDVLELPPHEDFPEYYLTPAETRAHFAAKGWRSVVGFQTRNPVHRAHEYLQKVALEMVDGLLLHPLVGQTKGDDIPADVRMRCYRVLLDNYYPLDRTLLSVNPASMRYAGPREAVFHALIRKNYGCTHFIVGRDHAGVGNYYGTHDAQQIFDEFDPAAIGIVPLKFEHTFWCNKCEGMASSKTCPHSPENRVSLSGTKVRAMLAAGEIPPMEFTRPEVAQILIEAMRQK